MLMLQIISNTLIILYTIRKKTEIEFDSNP